MDCKKLVKERFASVECVQCADPNFLYTCSLSSKIPIGIPYYSMHSLSYNLITLCTHVLYRARYLGIPYYSMHSLSYHLITLCTHVLYQARYLYVFRITACIHFLIIS